MKSKKAIAILVGVGMLIVGAIIILSVFVASDFSLEKLIGNDNSVKYDKTLELEDCDEVLVNLSTENIDIGVSSDDKVHVTYYDTDRKVHTLTQNDSTISLSCETTDESWHRFLYFNIWTDSYNDKILLPKDFDGKIRVTTATGDVDISTLADIDSIEIAVATGDTELDNVSARSASFNATTGNITLTRCEFESDATFTATTGKIKLNSISVNGPVSVKTTTGRITCDTLDCDSFASHSTTGRANCTELKANSVSMKSTTGNINLSRLDAASIDISATTGDVEGSVHGSENDYSIECNTSTGDCNLRSILRESGKPLRISTSTGNIDIDFVG